ncbi:hypothetical protein M422DRAFT_46083 [Sphaerobolus stellatus SS14]|uniref:(2E,6E)-farnesyl diphosphate synthase n=1 Tax=Sphaerobolus stellatus (strain SS14) TaxID=990650 RepID=A0A0C9VUN6_SPHS4|nr:hypothetical protein M422DRAFT_46083 [Sphaerobolus stellatus SS14]
MTESLTNVAERVCSSKWVTWWKPEYEAAVLEPYAYLTRTTGKEIRRKLIEAFNVWLKIPEEEVEVINSVVSMLHSASLMIDDVEDDSRLRRGQPELMSLVVLCVVVHKIYGIPQTINCANYVYFLAFKQLFKLRDQGPVIAEQEAQLDRLVTEELLNLHRGQGLDIFWRDNLICPSEEEYIDMVNNKTGGLFRIAIRLMMALSSSNIVYFQIRDDYMNLQSSEYETHKGFAEDLTEGKFSFPIIHAVRANRTDRQVINVLQKRPSTPTLKHHAVDYMRDQTKSFEYTLDVLQNLEKKIRVEIDRMGRNGPLIAVLDALRL